MTIHWAVEAATIIGVLSAFILAWGTIVIRMGRRHIDQRCAETIRDEVADIIGNGVTDRIDRLDNKLERLIDLHMNWDGQERRA